MFHSLRRPGRIPAGSFFGGAENWGEVFSFGIEYKLAGLSCDIFLVNSEI